MGDWLRGTSSRFTNRFQARLVMLLGIAILGGVATSAEDPPSKNARRKTVAAEAIQKSAAGTVGFNLPPAQNPDPSVPDPSFYAFLPNSHVSGEELVFQREIARVLCDRAESYPGREEHFAWLADDELFQKAVHRVNGLQGYILEAEELPGGGWLARVRVRPSVAAFGLAYIKDYIVEDYRFQDGVLTRIRTDAAVPRPDEHVLILH